MSKVIQFLKEVKVEFGNISWPKKESLIQLTFVVISISLIISLILGGFDYLFTQGIALIGRPTNNTNINNSIPPVVTIAPTGSTVQFQVPTIEIKPTTKK